MKAYPVEYRHRVLALTENGQTTSEIAEALGVSGAWVRSIKARHRRGDSLAVKSSANKRTSWPNGKGIVSGNESGPIRERLSTI